MDRAFLDLVAFVARARALADVARDPRFPMGLAVEAMRCAFLAETQSPKLLRGLLDWRAEFASFAAALDGEVVESSRATADSDSDEDDDEKVALNVPVQPPCALRARFRQLLEMDLSEATAEDAIELFTSAEEALRALGGEAGRPSSRLWVKRTSTLDNEVAAQHAAYRHHFGIP